MTQNYEHTDGNGSPNPDAEKWSNIGDKNERRCITREEVKELATQELGSQLHDVWREPRKQEDGSYEPRMKKTVDQDWIDKLGLISTVLTRWISQTPPLRTFLRTISWRMKPPLV